MGDPEAVGRALDRVHKPWLGWLWQGTRALVLALAVTLALTCWLAEGVQSLAARTVGQLEWTEPPTAADRVETAFATLYLAPGAITEADGQVQVEVRLWVEMRDVFNTGPQGMLWNLEVSDDREMIPGRSRDENGVWSETGYWMLQMGTDQSWTGYQWTIRLTLDHRPSYVELRYPYGGNDWTLRAEWEEDT